MARLSLVAIALAACLSCRATELTKPPYAFLAKGQTGIVWNQPVWNKHKLEGKFDVGPVPDPLGGPDNFFEEYDEGSVEGTYEVSLGIRSYLAEDTTIEVGIGYRQYEIENLSPVPDPNMRFIVETVDSMQFYLALRHYFETPGFMDELVSERWRMFGELGFHLAPGVNVDAELQFLTTTQPFDSKAEGYYFLSATGGLAYQVSDDLVAEFGVSWEHLLNPLEVDLTSTIDFGGGQVITIPVKGEMTPIGGLVFFSLVWYP
ncbi:MAG: hypothetical protein ACJAVJ_000889 [Planctomycetota bacterium]